MASIIFPSGKTIWVEDTLLGSHYLTELIEGIEKDECSISYRIVLISVLGKLGSLAEEAIPSLKKLIENKNLNVNEKILIEAAEQALEKIENRAMTAKTCRVEFNEVKFLELEEGPIHKGSRYYCKCSSCSKLTVGCDYYRNFSKNITLEDKFYCSFCLRNDIYKNNEIFILSFKGVFVYYYYCYYVIPKIPTMNFVDIGDMIDLHHKVGIQNPLFKYDNESSLWFIDLSKKNKVPIDDILNTIVEILACFNLYEMVPGCMPHKLFQKYKTKILEFDKTKEKKEKVFSPNLHECGIPVNGTKYITPDILNNINVSGMYDSHYKKLKQSCM